MAVDLLALLKIAPMKEETRQKLLTQVAIMSPTQKEQVSQACWTTLSQMYFARLKYEQEKLQLEISQGKRPFNKADFEEAEKRLTKEFSEKLKSSETEENLEEVRQELQKQLNNPNSPPAVQA